MTLKWMKFGNVINKNLNHVSLTYKFNGGYHDGYDGCFEPLYICLNIYDDLTEPYENSDKNS